MFGGAIKIRRGEPTGKLINFHIDVTPRTVQIPLVDDDAYDGGRLVYATKAGLAIPRDPRAPPRSTRTPSRTA